jgi:cytochrome P450/NADPH-cytochrome P450 reductase
VLKVRELRQVPHESDSTLHIDFEVPEGKEFKTAGNLVIFPENTPENVRKALACVGLNENDVLKVEPASQDTKLPCPRIIKAGDLFRKFVDLQGQIKPSVVKNLARFVADENIKKE